jgi:hypothetical protein
LVNTVIAFDGVITQGNSVDRVGQAIVIIDVDICDTVSIIPALCMASKYGILTVFIKGNKNQSVSHKLLIEQHGVNHFLRIDGGERNVGVVGIVVKVWSVEHVHRGFSTKSNIPGKVLLGIHNFLATSRVVADVVEGHERVVLTIFINQQCRFVFDHE